MTCGRCCWRRHTRGWMHWWVESEDGRGIELDIGKCHDLWQVLLAEAHARLDALVG